jgi:four helix bundle protein
MEYAYSFEKLRVWELSRKFVVDIYRLTEKFPASEKYGISAQIKRAAVSIVSNIAEGSSRTSKKDQAHFYQIAYGSLMETLCQIIISADLAYIDNSQVKEMRAKIENIAKMLNNLRKSQLLL